MAFEPSEYQKQIFEWGVSGSGSAVVIATAGSGKTTTCVEFFNRVIKSSSACFLAFNKHIADELKTRLPSSADCRTLHSLGYGALMGFIKRLNPRLRLNLESGKYRKIVQFLVAKYLPVDASYQERDRMSGLVLEILHFAQCNLVEGRDREGLYDLIEYYAIDTSGYSDTDLFDMVNAAMKEGAEQAKSGLIDFIDQIWLPNVWDLQCKKYDWIIVDEAQDLSKAQRQLVYRAMRRDTRVLAVGDGEQAINSFAGADLNSFNSFVDELDAVRLPLTVCYRCPTTHIELAKGYSTHIEPAPWAKEGSIERIKDAKLTEHVKEGDYILCRKTAPLIDACIRLIAAKKPAKVKGRDIAKGLIKIVNEIADQRGFQFTDFEQWLNTYRNRKLEKFERKDNAETLIQRLNDQLMGILSVHDNSECSSHKDLCNEIDALFDDNRASVWLMTVHRAKGLEGDRVFILEPSSLPLSWKGMKEWEEVAEGNVAFVAYTRSKDYLCFVDADE